MEYVCSFHSYKAVTTDTAWKHHGTYTVKYKQISAKGNYISSEDKDLQILYKFYNTT